MSTLATREPAMLSAEKTAERVTTTLTVDGRTSGNVSLASAGEILVAVWAATAPEGATDIYTAVSRDGARTFGSPVRVNDVDGDARVSGEMPPRVAVRRPSLAGAPSAAAQGEALDVTVSWVSKAGGTTIRFARSSDGGRTFSASRLVSQTDAAGMRGWQAMTVDARGSVAIVWLDHREMASHGGHQMNAASHATRDGAAMAQRSGLYVARIEGDSILPEQRVTTGVCYCCKTSIAAAGDGSLVTAWRHVYPGNIRDIAFARATDGRTFSAPVRVSADAWQLDGCPDDGPAIAVDGNGRTHIVWPTLVRGGGKDGQGTIALFYAMSRDGRSFTARQRIPSDGVAHHPQLAVAPAGRIAMAWDELKDGARRIVLARGVIGTNGRARFAREEMDPGVYPALAASAQATVVAWTSAASSGSAVRLVRIADASLR